MRKDEIRTLASAASTVLSVVGNGLKAQGKYKERDNWGTAGYSLRAGASLIDGWDDLKEAWNIIYYHTNRIFENAGGFLNQSKGQKSSPSSSLSLYTGVWSESSGLAHLLYHDRSTNASVLSWQRQNRSGSNTYRGYYSPNENEFVWTGYNSLGIEIFILGYPSMDGRTINSPSWHKNGNTGNLVYNGSILITK